MATWIWTAEVGAPNHPQDGSGALGPKYGLAFARSAGPAGRLRRLDRRRHGAQTLGREAGDLGSILSFPGGESAAKYSAQGFEGVVYLRQSAFLFDAGQAAGGDYRENGFRLLPAGIGGEISTR